MMLGNRLARGVFWLGASMALGACGDDGAPGGHGGQATSSTSGSTKTTGASSTTGATTTTGTATSATSSSGSASTTASTSASASSSSTGLGPMPECTIDADCYVNDDCCECAGRPNGEVPPACAIDDCAFTVCAQAGIPAGPMPSCQAGRCVSPIDCNAAAVTCDLPPPPCPAGTAAAISQGGCWANPALCIPVTECSAVTDCASCGATAGVGCVQNVAHFPSFHCVTLPTGCATDDCDCMGPSTCLEPFTACGEGNGQVTCTCITC